jgi:prepilin-type N-terminal cleavage/methylation domain-containing protein
MKQNNKNQDGFTIVELLIAVSVAAIASILMVSALVFMYGSLLREQTRSSMVLESQVFLRRMVDDIRVSNQILSTNALPDTYAPAGGWVTSDPANTLIMTQPATDSSRDFIFDDTTGYPYQNEIVYFGENNIMHRRSLANSSATGNAALTTCPVGTTGCSPDTQLTSYLQNMFFRFYDINDTLTTVPEEARSVELTVNLTRTVYGQQIDVSNKTRVTLRNEN